MNNIQHNTTVTTANNSDNDNNDDDNDDHDGIDVYDHDDNDNGNSLVQFRKKKEQIKKRNTLIMCKYVFNADRVADDNNDDDALG